MHIIIPITVKTGDKIVIISVILKLGTSSSDIKFNISVEVLFHITENSIIFTKSLSILLLK